MSKYIIPVNPPDPATSITIYYKDRCPFSMEALNLIKNTEINNTKVLFAAYEVSYYLNTIGHDKLFEELYKHGVNEGYKTYPMIFISNQFIGGCKELKELLIYCLNNKNGTYKNNKNNKNNINISCSTLKIEKNK